MVASGVKFERGFTTERAFFTAHRLARLARRQAVAEAEGIRCRRRLYEPLNKR